jgi:hypothetical protein
MLKEAEKTAVLYITLLDDVRPARGEFIHSVYTFLIRAPLDCRGLFRGHVYSVDNLRRFGKTYVDRN